MFVTLAGLTICSPQNADGPVLLIGLSRDCRYRCGSGADVTEGRQCRTNTSALFLELGENQLIPNTRVLIEMLVFT